MDIQALDKKNKSTCVPDGDDGDDGDDDDGDSDDDDDSDNDVFDKNKAQEKGGPSPAPSIDNDTEDDPPEDSDGDSNFSSDGESQAEVEEGASESDTDYEDEGDGRNKHENKKISTDNSALIQQDKACKKQDPVRQSVTPQDMKYLGKVMAKTGSNIEKEAQLISELTRTFAARVFMNGLSTTINHKDHALHAKDQAEKARKKTDHGRSDANELTLPMHSSELYHYDQTAYRKWIHMMGHTDFHLLLLTDLMVQKMTRSSVSARCSTVSSSLQREPPRTIWLPEVS
jgi:hypothetical protein